MALIIISDRKEVFGTEEFSHLRSFSDRYKLQHDFCRAIECEKMNDRPFLSCPSVKEYLAGFGIHYKGNYTLASEEWSNSHNPEGEEFVTYLNYPLQLSCLALFYEKVPILIAEPYLFELKYMLPVLRKRDLYLQLEDYGDVWMYMDAVEEGIEVRIAGKSSKDMPEKEFEAYLEDLSDQAKYLSREVDARVFPENFKELHLFEPAQMSLEEYMRSKDEEDEPDDTYL